MVSLGHPMVAGALLSWVTSTREHLGCVGASGDANVKATMHWRVTRAGLKVSEKCPPDANSREPKKKVALSTTSCPMEMFANLPHSWARVPASQGQPQNVCLQGWGRAGSMLARGDGLGKKIKGRCALQPSG